MSTFVDTTELEDAFPHVLPYVQGAPDPTVLYHLRQAAIEWCTRTMCWRADLDPVLTVVDQTAYDIPLPVDSALIRILGWSVNGGRPMKCVTPDAGQALRLNSHTADALWTADKVTFELNPVPAEAGKSIVLTVGLKPSQDALEIPTSVFEQHIKHIAAGAISSIAMLPRQPWTDMQLAALKAGEFTDNLHRTAAAVSRGNARVGLRVVGQFY